MHEPRSNLDFQVTSLMFKVRDLIAPRMKILEEVGIKPGARVLDFGCGSGSYVAGASKLAGDAGMVYAVDIHPAAVRSVERLAARKGLTNVQAIRSDCPTGLLDGSVDVALLYDVFHDLAEPDKVLAELHRVLKADGVLSVSDHHLSGDEIAARITGGGRFGLAKKGGKTHGFVKR